MSPQEQRQSEIGALRTRDNPSKLLLLEQSLSTSLILHLWTFHNSQHTIRLNSFSISYHFCPESRSSLYICEQKPTVYVLSVKYHHDFQRVFHCNIAAAYNNVAG